MAKFSQVNTACECKCDTNFKVTWLFSQWMFRLKTIPKPKRWFRKGPSVTRKSGKRGINPTSKFFFYLLTSLTACSLYGYFFYSGKNSLVAKWSNWCAVFHQVSSLNFQALSKCYGFPVSCQCWHLAAGATRFESYLHWPWNFKFECWYIYQLRWSYYLCIIHKKLSF